VCRRHSAAYLRHLHQTNEILGSRLATYHNLAFYADLLRNIRDAIDADRFLAFRDHCRASWGGDAKARRRRKRRPRAKNA
jgi:queuine tRNA-ribosyltransferase